MRTAIENGGAEEKSFWKNSRKNLSGEEGGGEGGIIMTRMTAALNSIPTSARLLSFPVLEKNTNRR